MLICYFYCKSIPVVSLHFVYSKERSTPQVSILNFIIFFNYRSRYCTKSSFHVFLSASRILSRYGVHLYIDRTYRTSSSPFKGGMKARRSMYAFGFAGSGRTRHKGMTEQPSADGVLQAHNEASFTRVQSSVPLISQACPQDSASATGHGTGTDPLESALQPRH
jgi:hypothetical protein